MANSKIGIVWAVIETRFHAKCRLEGEVAEFCHHTTLQYGVEKTDFAAYIGRSFKAKVLAECWDETIGAQALKVELQPEIAAICKNKWPHVTIFTRQGVEALMSNTMLDGPHHEAPAAVAELTMRIEFCPLEEIPSQEVSIRQK